MALEKGFTLTQITFPAREMLKELAYLRRKPMYKVLESLVREALALETQEWRVIASVEEHNGDI